MDRQNSRFRTAKTTIIKFGLHASVVELESAKSALNEIVRVQYFVRGGFVGYRSRASSKASLPSSSGRRARFLGGSNRGCVAPADARVGVGSTKPTRC
ncbi:hypothetical protein TNCV_2699251 [Trichonephila clavipes]|nr:hypothetical protein TNCV_2699251 [Trichonephila clavipes]